MIVHEDDFSDTWKSSGVCRAVAYSTILLYASNKLYHGNHYRSQEVDKICFHPRLGNPLQCICVYESRFLAEHLHCARTDLQSGSQSRPLALRARPLQI